MAVPSASTRYTQPPGRTRVARWPTIASSAPPLWASTWRSITTSTDPGSGRCGRPGLGDRDVGQPGRGDQGAGRGHGRRVAVDGLDPAPGPTAPTAPAASPRAAAHVGDPGPGPIPASSHRSASPPGPLGHQPVALDLAGVQFQRVAAVLGARSRHRHRDPQPQVGDDPDGGDVAVQGPLAGLRERDGQVDHPGPRRVGLDLVEEPRASGLARSPARARSRGTRTAGDGRGPGRPGPSGVKVVPRKPVAIPPVPLGMSRVRPDLEHDPPHQPAGGQGAAGAGPPVGRLAGDPHRHRPRRPGQDELDGALGGRAGNWSCCPLGPPNPQRSTAEIGSEAS